MPLSPTSRSSLVTATSVLALMVASSAQADVTAADVWQNLNAPLGALGMTVSANASQNGNITTYNDIRYDFSLPMGIGGGSLTSPAIALIENGDGTVTVQYPNAMDMSLSGFITGEGAFSMDMSFQMAEATSLTATGTPGDITYTGTSGDMSFSVGNIMVDGQLMDVFSVTADIRSSGSLTQHIVEGDLVEVSISTTSGVTEMDMTMSLDDPSGAIMAELQTTNQGNATLIEMALPADGSSLLNLAPAFEQGLAFVFASETAGTEQRQTITNDLGVVVSDQTTTSGPSTASGRLDQRGFALDAAIEGMSIQMQDQSIPVPLAFELASARAGYAFPLTADAAPQDFSFLLSLDDLSISDNLWSLFDPAGQLDRTPADLTIDLAGSTVLSADVTNFLDFGMRLDQGEMVATIESLDLRELNLGALGAVARATAALTFDNTDFFTYPGMPKPVGNLEFSIEGLNSALDQLVAIGLISQDEIFGMRMMLGMIATPTSNDGLAGTIELGPDGSITANGQRLR